MWKILCYISCWKIAFHFDDWPGFFVDLVPAEWKSASTIKYRLIFWSLLFPSSSCYDQILSVAKKVFMAFSYRRFLRIKINSLNFDFLCNSFSVGERAMCCCRNQKNAQRKERSIYTYNESFVFSIVSCYLFMHLFVLLKHMYFSAIFYVSKIQFNQLWMKNKTSG